MRLNCALVPSFLFVSAVQVLALDRVEKSINSTDLAEYNLWAGGVRVANSEIKDINYASGTFTVPSAVGVFGEEFDIAVGLGGFTPCSYFTLGVGISVKITEDMRVSYQAWGRWANDVDFRASAAEFQISTGNVITVIVSTLNFVSGVFALINHTDPPRVWGGYLRGQATDCYKDAEWVVSTRSQGDQQLPFPNFIVVNFQGIRMGFRERPLEVPNFVNTIDIQLENGRELTHSTVVNDIVTIRVL